MSLVYAEQARHTKSGEPSLRRSVLSPTDAKVTPFNLDEAQCWQAVCARDRNADGRFVYAVKTTSVYCRPSCPSRRAKRENIVFFADAATAENSGFRACRRCRPHLSDRDDAMTAVAEYILAHAEQALTLEQLAEHFQLSPFHLQRRFKAAFGVTPKAFQTAERFDRLKQALRAGDDITGAIFEAGFGSTSRVYEALDQQLGMTPSEYRAGGEHLRIDYAIRTTAVGMVIMAATERGVCFVHFGEDAATLQAALTTEFPMAECQPSAAQDAPQLDAWMAALENHLNLKQPLPPIPLHLSGTAFQMRVWRFLATMTGGQTTTYKEVAQAINRPSAHRAVANACGANQVAVLIPCHRVLRGDGGIGGYRWGVSRKQKLLAREAGET